MGVATEDRMFKARIVTGISATLALFACSPAEMPSRGLAMDATLAAPMQMAAPNAATAQPHYNVVAIDTLVPHELLVSEADIYLPIADIVWHGDPEGDRYAQIEAIFDAALGRATQDMTTGRDVRVVVQVEKFHGVTPKTRATVGGNFAMHFYLTVLDANTAEVLDGPRLITADTHASGGVRALREEQRGITQKVVVTERLVQVLDAELAKPGVPNDSYDLRITRAEPALVAE